MRKIKYVHQYFDFFIRKIIKNFPIIDHLHPFFGDLLNILFNRNNYKIALNHLNKSRFAVSKISTNHLRLLKYGKSLYNCQQIKKTALGKICKNIKKLESSLLFLEKIRLQLKKIPKIDPHRKTILIGGSQGSGKSSLMNKITRANVTVTNGSYTSKNLFLGHFSVNFFQWQVIDSPGIAASNFFYLNSFEIQTMNVYANLNCLIFYLIDFGPNFKSSKQKQFKILFRLRKLINKKKKNFILTKTDLNWEKNIDFKKKTFLNFLIDFEKESKIVSKASCHDEIGIMSVREKNFCLNHKHYGLRDKNVFQHIRKDSIKKKEENQEKVKNTKTLRNQEKKTKIFPSILSIYQNDNNLRTKKSDQNQEEPHKEDKLREFFYEKSFSSYEIEFSRLCKKVNKKIKIYPKTFDFFKLGLLKLLNNF